MLQKRLHTKVRQRRSKKYRGQLTLMDLFHIERLGCTVQEFNLFHKIFIEVLSYHLLSLSVINGNDGLFRLLGPACGY